MTIYAEYLFAENFIAGLWILRLTALLCGRTPKRWRIAAGAALCGLFSFIILLNLSGIMTLIYELVFVLAVTEVTFGSMGIRLLTKIGAVFYCVSFLLGGSVFALLMMIGAGGTVNNGFIYIGSGGYLLILAGAAAGGGMALWILKYVKRHSSEESSVFQLTIDLMNKKLRCEGKVDSANFLREPVSGKPVSLISAKEAEKCWGDILENESLFSRIRAVPYRSVGCSDGIVMAVRCDSLTIDRGGAFGGNRICIKDVFLGLYDGEFAAEKEDGKFSVLLQPEVVYEGSAQG